MSFPFFLYKLAGALAVPPGLLCLLLFLAAGAALRPPRRPRLGAFLEPTLSESERQAAAIEGWILGLA